MNTDARDTASTESAATAATSDGSVPPTTIDAQLAMLSHYVYTHQNTMPDSEIWKALEYVSDFARLGAKLTEMAKGRDLRHSGSGHWRVLQYECGAGTPYIGLTRFYSRPIEALYDAAETPEHTIPADEIEYACVRESLRASGE